MIYCQFENIGGRKNRCKVCGFDVDSPHPPDKIIRNCTGPSLPITLPKLNENFNRLYKEGVKTLNRDYGHCSREQYKTRLRICSNCPKLFTRTNRTNWCNFKIENNKGFNVVCRARKQAAKCPLGKWKSRYIKPYKNEMPLLYNVEGAGLFLRNHYKDTSIFFIGAGPSLLDYDLASLSQRGLITFGVNGVATKTFRPNLWTCVDTPLSFHESIWLDPAITKFISGGWSGHKFSTENRGQSDLVVSQCPNIILYDKNDFFEPDKFFEEQTIAWGCAENVKDILGITGGRSVMLVAFKIIAYLGFKRIYLLGCDFNMQYDPEKNGKGITYAFNQYKNQKACSTNNTSFIRIEKRLKSLLPGLKQQNIKVYNCNEKSKLEIFPYKSFDDCKKQALKNFPAKITTQGLYK